MTTEEWVPPGVDPTKPSVARVYDYMIGGKDNFAVDREVARAALAITPDGPQAGLANRAFLRRSVRYLAGEAGVTQFLDIGSGLPTQGNVHEIAGSVNPAAKTVYVDNDPIVLAHGRALLANSPNSTVIQAELRDPQSILNHPEVRAFIDFDRPVGLLMLGILHHLNDHEDPAGIAAVLRDALPSGSYLVITHFHDPQDAHPDASQKARAVEKIFNESLGTGRWRTHDEIMRYFGDFEMVEPGLVPLAEWRPDDRDDIEQTDTYYTFVGGVARKR